MLIKDKMKFNLQFFADPEGANPEGSANPNPDGGANPTVFDQSEVDRRISKAVESALNKQQEKFNAEKETAIEEAKRKAEEYSKLTEREKAVKELEAREKKVKEEALALDQRKLLTDVEVDLKEKKLPLSFATALITLGDAEKIKEIVTDLKKDFDLSVAEQVKESLRQKTPEENNSIKRSLNNAKSITDFARENRIVGK